MQRAPTVALTGGSLSNAVASMTATATPSLGLSALSTATVGDTGPATPGERLSALPSIITATQLPLVGRKIGIDPGHGPRDDMGAVLVDPDTGKLVLSEAEFTLDVALRCRDILRARGASVVLTRESADTFTSSWPSDANGDGEVGSSGDDLQERVDILNRFHAEVFLSIHANSGKTHPPTEDDIQVLYCGDSDCAFPTESKRLGRLVLDQLRAKLASVSSAVYGGQALTDLEADSSIPPEHIFILGPANPPRHLRTTAMPGVLAESLYVSSPAQAAQLKQSSVRQAIALAYADALQAYLTAK